MAHSLGCAGRLTNEIKQLSFWIMKTWINLGLVLTAGWMLQGCASSHDHPPYTSPAREGRAVVRAVRGPVYFSVGNQSTKLKTGMALRPGTTIRTPEGSTAELSLGPNGRLVRLTPGTELTLEQLNFSEGDQGTVHTVLNLRQGRIQGKVGKLPPGSRYEVITPQGTANLSGDDFGVDADKK